MGFGFSVDQHFPGNSWPRVLFVASCLDLLDLRSWPRRAAAVKGEEEGGSVTPPLGKKRGRPKMRTNSIGRKLGRPAKKRVKNGEAAAAAAAELVSCEKCPEQLKV